MANTHYPGKAIVLTAPSGAGKTTLLAEIKKEFPSLEESVSYTTRAARPGEIHGKSYFFIPLDEFKEKIQSGDFLEWEEVHGNFYGTDRDYVENALKEGKVLIFDVDVKGARSLKETFPEARTLFILPPSLAELEDRLRSRATESEEAITRRVSNASQELKVASQFDYQVMNRDFLEAAEELKKIFREIIDEA